MKNKNTRPILLVEDDAAIVEAIDLIFKDLNRELVVATNGKEAIDYLTKLREDQFPSAIILDLMMPRMTGQQFIFHIQALGKIELDSIPIIVSSASNEADTLNDPRVRYVLKKPIDITQIEKMVEYYS